MSRADRVAVGDATQEIESTISTRPPWVSACPRLLSVEQVIERIEDLRSLIPERVAEDG